ncbi:MAG: mechanosensitive ion channel domain-containing protein [Candidatus Hodarchaeota archaeon]
MGCSLQTFYDYLIYFWANFGILVIYGIVMLSMFIVQRVLVKNLRKRYTDLGLSPDSANTLVLMFRIIFVVIAIVLTLTVISSTFIGLYIDPAWLISISALIGTAIGLASAQALGNIIAGFYILISRPFRIGDLVRIGDEEGIIDEITLNYSKILTFSYTKTLIPNSKVLSSNVMNYRISKDRLSEILGEEIILSDEKGLINKLKKLISEGEKFYIYNFDFPIKPELKVGAAKKAFEKVCNDWGSVFGHVPLFGFAIVSKAGTIKNVFSFYLVVNDPRIILDKRGEFIESLVSELDEI